MGFFSRLFKIGEAKANNVLEGLEKPELMLEQAIRDKEEKIAEVKRAVQGCIATERQNKALLEREREEGRVWEERAKEALKMGKEDLAVKALERSQEHTEKTAELEKLWKSERDQVEMLKKDLLQMEEDVEEYKRNKDFIIAQSKTAEVRKEIYEAKAKMSEDDDTDALLERMKKKAERSSHEAEAAKEMAELSGGKDSLEKEFESLKKSTPNASIQSKLDALKSELGR